MRLVALDWVNFFLADVRGGLGAYLIVYLLTKGHWSQATIGGVLTVSGLAGIMLHPALGALIDRARAKRALLVAGVVVLSICGPAIVWAPSVPVVLAADVTMAALGGLFAPVVAAITVGLCESRSLPARLGRNAAFDRIGNVFIAVVAGLLGTIFSQAARRSAARMSLPAATASRKAEIPASVSAAAQTSPTATPSSVYGHLGLRR